MIVADVVIVLVLLALITQLGVLVIERRHPPQGQMVDVAGARLHIVDIGPHHTGEPAVVLIHGASANLESMRQPLGDMLARRHRVILIDRPGHGWSTRARREDATPAIEAAMIDEALARLGVTQAVVVGHSWAGALVPELALKDPQRIAGVVMLAPVTHPWPGGIAWYHHVATTPVLGPLFAYTLALPVGALLMGPGAKEVFLPQAMPENYVRDTAVALLLRPHEFITNGWDMVMLKEAVRAQVPGYSGIKVPTVVISGDADGAVSPDIHARQFVKAVAGAKLIILPGVGHLVQNAAPEMVIAEVESLLAPPAAMPAAAAAR